MTTGNTPAQKATKKKAAPKKAKAPYAYHRDTRLPPAILQPTLRLLAESKTLPLPPKHRPGHKNKQADIDRLTDLVEPIHEAWKALEKRIKRQLGNGDLCGISGMKWEQGLWGAHSGQRDHLDRPIVIAGIGAS